MAKRGEISLRTHYTFARGAEVLPPELTRRSFFSNISLRLCPLSGSRSFAHCVVLTDIVKRPLQVLDKAHGSKWLSAAGAMFHLGIFSCAPVQLHANSCRTFDNVEEFPER